MTNISPRALIADLHTIAELIETGADLPTVQISNSGGTVRVSYHFWSDDAAAKIAAALRLFPGVKFTKNAPGNDYDDAYYIMSGQMEYGTTVQFFAKRATVCNRVVTATETITEELPDPAEVAKLPTVKHERVVETVEWQCVPLLAKAAAVAS